MSMQREIKFRAWYSGKMVEVEAAEFFTDGTIHVNEELVGATLEQFTGLRDKNGKEIYEGDVVNIACNPYHGHGVVKFGTYQKTPFHKHQIEIEHLGWYIDKDGEPIPLPHSMREPKDTISSSNSVEVIGNIHENPELRDQAEISL